MSAKTMYQALRKIEELLARVPHTDREKQIFSEVEWALGLEQGSEEENEYERN